MALNVVSLGRPLVPPGLHVDIRDDFGTRCKIGSTYLLHCLMQRWQHGPNRSLRRGQCKPDAAWTIATA